MKSVPAYQLGYIRVIMTLCESTKSYKELKTMNMTKQRGNCKEKFSKGEVSFSVFNVLFNVIGFSEAFNRHVVKAERWSTSLCNIRFFNYVFHTYFTTLYELFILLTCNGFNKTVFSHSVHHTMWVQDLTNLISLKHFRDLKRVYVAVKLILIYLYFFPS